MKKILTFFISLYQVTLGTLKGHTCRFDPTCSEYTKQAIKHHGALRGTLLGAKRVSTCHPWSSKSGYDPVPEKSS
ncbi:MAG: membrane protein insertion efficiency factor YidD [Candidatus Nomurabacteria bacterium]|nr:membrane protein insertion efficiency factor YidD [Candidatus Nomurabacteria bacterium]